MRPAKSIPRLLAELRQDHALIEQNFSNFAEAERRFLEARDELDFIPAAYFIHNIYNAFENYFLRVCKFFENDLDQAEWHKEVLFRMGLHIDKLRPELLAPESIQALDELRRFRHVFRNLYTGLLEKERLLAVMRLLPGIRQRFAREHGDFVAALKKIQELLDADS
jgi:hypothetical protein